ncbi:unnamed protein product [Medioppia subpectinata]|uniref:RING-type domain-containing protein n=1 Tax=Medioppia subpectinata TaxID=1979941 RepID=A0A7R9KI43_9ACAR|nr:unnamed protein product [Medioppia subpectinata]CAG2103721.1 unnamed protein product [Medioppia subpectinata]
MNSVSLLILSPKTVEKSNEMYKSERNNTSERQTSTQEQAGGPGGKPPTYKRPRLSDINAELTCILCNGYFIDATTISECLHSFCKSCIVKYLLTNKCCPICETQVHGTKPLLSIRSDKILQDIVYKLIPDVFKNEMHRRRDYYTTNTEAVPVSAEDRGEVVDHRMFYMANDKISLSLEYGYGENQTPENGYKASAGNTSSAEKHSLSESLGVEAESMKRYLLCPAGLSVLHLKKFIVKKYGLPTTYRVDVMYLEDILSDDITLMDVAYIYDWKRSDPMRLFYRISERPIKRLKTTHPLNIESKSGSGGSVNSANSDTSNANNHNHNNNNASVSQSKLVGAHPASSRSSQNSTSTIIMTGAAPVPTTAPLKAHNSGANGVTSGKGSTVTPKLADTAKGASNTIPIPTTPPGILKSKSTHTMSASALQTDEPPKKLRKILPANSALTPKPVPIAKANSAITANTTSASILPSNTSTTSTVNSLRQCRINTDKSKLSSSSSVGPVSKTNASESQPNVAINAGLSAETTTKQDIKDTKSVNPSSDSVTTKRNTSRKSSAFDVRTLIGTKSPTLPYNRTTEQLFSDNEFTKGNDSKDIHHKNSTSDTKSASQAVKQSKGRDVNRNRLNTSQSLISSTPSSITSISTNNSKQESMVTSRPHTKSAPIDREVTHESSLSSPSHAVKNQCKSGTNSATLKQTNAKPMKQSLNDISVKNCNTNRDKAFDITNKILAAKPINGLKSGSQTQSTPTQRQSNPLSPPPIRIKLSPPPPQTTSTNKSCTKSAALPSASIIQTDGKHKVQKQSIEESDAKKQLSDPRITTTTDKLHKPIEHISNHSLSKSGISQSSNKTKGASINQIVSKIASGVTAKSASVNVTSSTPTLQLTNNSTSSTQLTSTSHTVTPNHRNDHKVNTTTGETGLVGSSTHTESGVKSVTSSGINSGNLVIRISTKTHSVESLVSPKDKSAHQKINNKCETKRDVSNSSANSSSKSSSSASEITHSHSDCKTTKTSANESLNEIKDKTVKKESENTKSVDSLRINSNSGNNSNGEEDDDEDDMKLVVDMPNEDSCENDIITAKDKAEDKHSMRSESNDVSLRSASSPLLTVRSRVPSHISTKLAISITSGTTLSANSAVLTSPPPTPTPSPKSESDPSVSNETKPNSSTNGPLDLSMSTKKDRQQQRASPAPVRAIYDIPPSKPKQCVNPAVLDKHRGLFTTASTPKQQYQSFKIMNSQSSQDVRSSSGSSAQRPNAEHKKNRSISSPVISSNTTSGNHQVNSSRHRSVSHSGSHHHSSHHNHNQKNYSVITPDPRRYSPKIVIRNIGSPPSTTSHFNYPTHR